jgi:hypothetical protein
MLSTGALTGPLDGVGFLRYIPNVIGAPDASAELGPRGEVDGVEEITSSAISFEKIWVVVAAQGL